MEMIRLLEQVLRNSRAVDREALCVLAGHKVSISYPGRERTNALQLTIQGIAELTSLSVYTLHILRCRDRSPQLTSIAMDILRFPSRRGLKTLVAGWRRCGI